MKNKATRHYSLALRYALSVTGKKVSRRARGVAKAKPGCIPERFWDFPRGSAEQPSSKQHWDSSGKDVFLSMEDVLKYLVEMEGRPAEQVAPASPERPGPR